MSAPLVVPRHRASPRRKRPRAEPVAGRRTRPVLAIGVDTGGTFTDIVFREGARSGTYKLPSTPDDPARAVLEGLSHLFGDRAPERLTYGTTVATNAMLERRGVRTVLVTTQGFEDVLEIGRQARPYLYDLEPRRDEPLVPARLRFGVDERARHDGTIERRPDPRELAALVERVRRSRAGSIAVCLLHAHATPAHERIVGGALAALGIPVTLSHELCPLPGEYERTATTVANAYVRPIVASHLEKLAQRSRARRLRVMQSNGGAIGVETAANEPVRTMLSGPAGGVAAAFRCAEAAGLERIVSFDMGGTSTDVSLIDGAVPRRAETSIGEVPLRVPSIDIHTVGAGGGSIASVDPGRALKVGPESAGAEPGPACYGRGRLATVTDANVVLGRLRGEAFLGGAMRLDAERARAALDAVARAMGARSAEHAAEGVVQVVQGTMERAIRVITVERGHDPRTCALIAFGGAAGLHACGLAEALGVPTVVVPHDPGLLSAWGVLDGPVVRDVVQPLREIDATYEALARAAEKGGRDARRALEREGFSDEQIITSAWVRMRYLGQSIELEIALTPSFRAAFDREHMRLLHTSSPSRSIEVMGVRVSAAADAMGAGRARTAARRRMHGRTSAPTAERHAPVWLAGRMCRTAIYARDALEPSMRIAGPAIVTEYSSTVLVPPRWRLSVDSARNLRLSPQPRSRNA